MIGLLPLSQFLEDTFDPIEPAAPVICHLSSDYATGGRRDRPSSASRYFNNKTSLPASL
jgi:hypothetical protein